VVADQPYRQGYASLSARSASPTRCGEDLHRVARQSVVGSSHIVEDAYRQRICRNEYRKRPIIRAAQPADGAQNLLLQRSEALPTVAGNRNTRIGGRIEYPADHVMGLPNWRMLAVSVTFCRTFS
jgi:hypothetical protein